MNVVTGSIARGRALAGATFKDWSWRDRSPVLWITYAIGWAVIAIGFYSLFHAASSTKPANFAKWFLGIHATHDLVLAPLTGVVGLVIVAVVPRRLRSYVQTGVILSLLVLAVGWVPLRGYTNRPENPTIQPLHYSTSVATALVIVWAVMLATLVINRARPSIATLLKRVLPSSK